MTQLEILKGAAAMIATDPFFPPAEINVEAPSSFRTDCGGQASALSDAVAVQGDEQPKVTRDGGAADDYEMEAEVLLVYAVSGADDKRRLARREEGVRRLANLVRQDRTLGTGDPQVYAEIDVSPRADKIPVRAAAQAATVLFTLRVTYVSASPAE